MVKDKGFLICFSIYIVLFLADIVTTLMNYEYLKFLEANLVYKYIGIFGIIIINLLVALALYKYYHAQRTTFFMRYYLLTFMIGICLLRLYAIRNAVMLLAYPIPLELAKELGTSAAKQGLAISVSLVGYAFMAFNCFTFWLFSKDHTITRNELRK